MYQIAKQILTILFMYYQDDKKLDITLHEGRQRILLHNGVMKHLFVGDKEEYIYKTVQEALDSDDLVFILQDLDSIIKSENLKFDVRLV